MKINTNEIISKKQNSEGESIIHLQSSSPRATESQEVKPLFPNISKLFDRDCSEIDLNVILYILIELDLKTICQLRLVSSEFRSIISHPFKKCPSLLEQKALFIPQCVTEFINLLQKNTAIQAQHICLKFEKFDEIELLTEFIIKLSNESTTALESFDRIKELNFENLLLDSSTAMGYINTLLGIMSLFVLKYCSNLNRLKIGQIVSSGNLSFPNEKILENITHLTVGSINNNVTLILPASFRNLTHITIKGPILKRYYPLKNAFSEKHTIQVLQTLNNLQCLHINGHDFIPQMVDGKKMIIYSQQSGVPEKFLAHINDSLDSSY